MTPPLTDTRRVLCSLCLCSSALAAGEGLPPAQEALRLQQQQHRALQDLQLEQRRRQLLRSAAQAPAPAAAQPTPEDEPCWPLQGTRLVGVTLFSPSRLQAWLKPNLAPCMGVNRINRLLAEITRLYVEADRKSVV